MSKSRGFGLKKNPIQVVAENKIPPYLYNSVWVIGDVPKGIETDEGTIIHTVANLPRVYGLEEGSTIFDPFASIMVAMTCSGCGYKYKGLVQSKQEKEKMINRLKDSDEKFGGHLADNIELIINSEERLITGSQISLDMESIDMLITNASIMDRIWDSIREKYNDFDESRSFSYLIGECSRILMPGSFSAWIIISSRDTDGNLHLARNDILDEYIEEEYTLKDEIILYNPRKQVKSKPPTMDTLNRVHEKCLVFQHPIPF